MLAIILLVLLLRNYSLNFIVFAFLLLFLFCFAFCELTVASLKITRVISSTTFKFSFFPQFCAV